jgi:hypothetical protein
MQMGAGCGARTRNIACVLGDFGFNKNDMEHILTPFYLGYVTKRALSIIPPYFTRFFAILQVILGRATDFAIL